MNEAGIVPPKRRLRVRAVFAACGAAGWLACGSEAPAPVEPIARPVKIFSVAGPGEEQVLEFPGKIRAAQQADMAFEVPGKVVAFPVNEGQPVREGTVLARLDPRDYEAQLEKAQAVVDQAKTDMDRFQYLYEQGVNSKRDFELRQRNYELSVSNLRIAQKAVEDTVLRAHFDGEVGRKLVEDFVNVQAKEVVLILQDHSHFEIRVAVPEQVLARARPGGFHDYEAVTARTKPVVVLSALPGQRFPARIKEMATAADPVTRTFDVTLVFERPGDTNILPGMTGKVIVHTAAGGINSDEITIPAHAVLADESGEAFVWLVDPDSLKVRRGPVSVGEMSGADIAVTSGLSAGDWIAVSGVHQLREGMTVRRYEP